MFTVLYPHHLPYVLSMPQGIHAFYLDGKETPFYIVKMMHSYLLTARMNKGLKVYVVPLTIRGQETIGLLTAFFDDPDSPLSLWSPMANEPNSTSTRSMLLGGKLHVYMFDEHNREFLGYEATVSIPEETRTRFVRAQFISIDHVVGHEMHQAAMTWFGTRTSKDDDEAISIDFATPLYPEDIHLMDMDQDKYQFHGSKGFGSTQLVKEEPGQFQEIDIILLLQRIFTPDQIYYAPKRVNDGEEICDVMVISDSLCIVIQAKDSPNTELMLGNSLERKKKKAISQLEGGLKQVSGAISYMRRTQPLSMLIDDGELVVDLSGLKIVTLVVVRELFMDSYDVYSEKLFSHVDKVGIPCFALEYAELHNYTAFVDGEEGLFDAFRQVQQVADERGIYPRLRFGVKDLVRGDGTFRFSPRG